LIDEKLKKLLEADGPDPALLPGDLPDRLIEDLHSGTDVLLFAPPGSGKTTLALSVLGRLDSARRALYVSPRLTPFAAARMASTLTANVSLRHPADLWGRPSEHPDLLILDDLQELPATDGGPDMELFLLRLSADVPVLYLCDPASDPETVLDWLKAARSRPCRMENLDLPETPRIAALYTTDGEMTPLTDRKRVANKAKKRLKTLEPAHDPAAGRVVRDLVTGLRHADLTPALILMADADACDRAAAVCPKGNRTPTPGDLLTHPRIMALLDDHPFLKDYPALQPALSRRAAPRHPDHHPLWNRLVEEWVALGGLDTVFAMPEEAVRSAGRFRSILFATSGTGPDPRTEALADWEMDRIIRLSGRPGIDTSGLVAVVHTTAVDPVFVKDHLIKPAPDLTSALECGIRTSLALLAGDVDPADDLKRALKGFRQPAFGRFCLDAIAADVADELSTPACSGHIQSVASLKNLRLRLDLRLGRLAGITKSATGRRRRDLVAESTAAEALMADLPCQACPHRGLCHGRGTRRFREALSSYYELAERIRESATGLWADFRHSRACLAAFDLMADSGELSVLGLLAHRTGLETPQPLTEGLRNEVLPLPPEGSEDLAFSLIGGFIETDPVPRDPETDNLLSDCFQRLKPYWDVMAPVLERTRKELLRFGILSPDYDRVGSAALLAWRQGIDPEILTLRTRITPGSFARLTRKATDLWHRVADPEALSPARENG
jgi:hypothetical protein